MSENWKPGDVAVCVSHGERVLKAEGFGEWWHLGHDVPQKLRDHDIRRLVVIDAEDREQVKQFHDAFYAVDTKDFDPKTVRLLSPHHARCQAAFRLLASPTPSIDEPTNLYAVVREVGGHEWCHIGGQVWRSLSSSGQFMVEKHWHDADVPLAGNVVAILAEGVTA